MIDEKNIVFKGLKKEKEFSWSELFKLYKEKTNKSSPSSFYSFLRELILNKKIIKLNKNNYLVKPGD